MNGITLTRVVTFACAVLVSVPAFAQVDLNGTYILQMHEDYLERGPGSDMGDFTGVPLNDEGRAKALLFTSDQLSMIERQCLHWSPFVTLYRPLGPADLERHRRERPRDFVESSQARIFRTF